MCLFVRSFASRIAVLFGVGCFDLFCMIGCVLLLLFVCVCCLFGRLGLTLPVLCLSVAPIVWLIGCLCVCGCVCVCVCLVVCSRLWLVGCLCMCLLLLFVCVFVVCVFCVSVLLCLRLFVSVVCRFLRYVCVWCCGCVCVVLFGWFDWACVSLLEVLCLCLFACLFVWLVGWSFAM